MVKNRRVLCPTCRKQTVYDVRQSFRPFCSERCQILDLGKWADEKFRLASEEHARPGSEQGEDDDCRVPRHHLN